MLIDSLLYIGFKNILKFRDRSVFIFDILHDFVITMCSYVLKALCVLECFNNSNDVCSLTMYAFY